MTSQTSQSVDLLVVIVNFRTPDLTIQCLRSLVSQVRDVPSTRVIVTDNASGDDSIPRIQAAIDAKAAEGTDVVRNTQTVKV